ncbi:MAG: WbqC family protein [PVC group bacterium]|nr:WbqC family protein [PVC group bacterium]
MNKKSIAIMQPGYMPWLGFFDLMHKADLFVFLDDVQYTKRDWRSRNRIRTEEGWQWLSVPVFSKNRYKQLIKDVTINNTINWRRKHLNALELNYHKAEFFNNYYSGIKDIISQQWDSLCGLNINMIKLIADVLGIETPYILSSELNIKAAKSRRVLEICKELNADELYDSEAAAGFLDTSLFEKENIKVEFQKYKHPVYAQLYSPFYAYMTTLDLLFNCGENSLKVIEQGSEYYQMRKMQNEDCFCERSV